MQEDGIILSTIVSLEDLSTTIVTNTYTVIYVRTFDAPGAYLHAETPKDKRVILKLEGYFGYIMCRVNPEHETNVIIKR